MVPGSPKNKLWRFFGNPDKEPLKCSLETTVLHKRFTKEPLNFSLSKPMKQGSKIINLIGKTR